MNTAKLVKWGNSLGIRIFTQDIKQANAYAGEEFKVIINSDGGFTLTPIKSLQKKWLELFNAAADKESEALLIDQLNNDFDKDEWQW